MTDRIVSPTPSEPADVLALVPDTVLRTLLHMIDARLRDGGHVRCIVPGCFIRTRHPSGMCSPWLWDDRHAAYAARIGR